jgi:spermidine synthase
VSVARRSLLLATAACFFLSGAAGLLYEVVWVRLLGLLFGHTVYAVTTVLAAYMGGLAAGSLLLGRRADRIARPLRTYALLEAGIGAYCLATPVLFAVADRVYVTLARVGEPSAATAAAIHIGFSLVLLGLPTTLMGMTLPLLSRAVVERASLAGARVGTLYALNTWGAVVGAALTGYHLLPALGLRTTVGLGVAANVVVAAAALLTDLRLRRYGPPAHAPGGDLREPAAPREKLPGRAVAVALVAVGVSGAASMGYEIAWTRALSLVVGSSTYAFSAMLTTFLVGIALGAFVVARFLVRRAPGLLAFAWVEIAIAFAAVLLLPVFGELPGLFLRFIGAFGLSHESALLAQFLGSFLVMIVPTVLVGATFPLAVAVVASGVGSVGRDVGRVYGASTLGTIVGSAAAGFALIPLIGIQNTVLAAAAANLAAGIAVLVARGWAGPRIRVGALAAVVGFAVLASAVPRWDRKIMASGVAVYAQKYLRPDGGAKGLLDALGERELMYYQEGINTTVTVTRTGQQLQLAVNGKIDGGNGSDMATQVLAAHLPAILAPDARRALVIGLGTGITAGCLAQHPVERVDVAELEPAMLRAASFFDSENHGALRDPRVRIRAGDGRHLLAAASEPYDIIMSEPSNPWIAGVANLFTLEFYELARSHLAPRGVMVQWVQGYSIFPRELRMIVRTFRSVFPNATMWRGSRGDFLLVATREEVPLDLELLRRRIASVPAIREDFARLRMEPVDLLQAFLLAPEDAARYAEGAPLNTDDLPLLEFAAPRALYAFSAQAENEEVVQSFRRVRWPSVRGVPPGELEDPSRLLANARSAWLRGNVDAARGWISRLPAHLPAEVRLERARLLFGTGRLSEAADAFEEILRDEPEHPTAAGYLRACRSLLERNLAIALVHASATVGGGDEAQGYANFGGALVQLTLETGERDLLPIALEHLDAALELRPSASLAVQAVLVHLEMKDPDGALRQARRAVAREGNDALSHFALGLALRAKGQHEAAVRAFREAARISPEWAPPREQLAAMKAR